MELRIRRAREADLPAILDIYNYEVATSTSTWDEEPHTLAQRRAWLRSMDRTEPVLVAEADSQVGGFAYLHRMSDKAGWRFTREDTIYLHRDFRGRGVGRALLSALLEEAQALGLHLVVATISDDNEASLALHRSLGFEVAGRLEECGYKFGRWLSVVYMRKRLEG
ncbi:MAG: L-methionine sulfoximine N-acetyltransferase [Dehalococcoidia bacterium]